MINLINHNCMILCQYHKMPFLMFSTRACRISFHVLSTFIIEPKSKLVGWTRHRHYRLPHF